MSNKLPILKSKVDKAIWEFYKRIYLVSEPIADFDTLYINGTLEEDGRISIPFNDYVVDAKVFAKIKEEVRTKYKIKNPLSIQKYSFHVELGPSPRCKHEETIKGA